MMIAPLDFDINAIGRDFIDTPYPTLKALRETAPVYENSDGSVFLTRHSDIHAIYRNKAMLSDKVVAFGEKFGDGPLFEHHTTSLIFRDPPEHTIVRKLLSVVFSPRKMAEMQPLIEAIVDRLLDRAQELEQFDFVTEFAMALPTEIISFMLGIPQSHRHKLRGFSLSILGALDPVISKERLDAGNAAVTEFSDLLRDLIAHRRANPEGAGQGEVLDSLIFGEVEGRRLSEKELIQNCIFLLNAGHETTTSMLSNAVGMLLAHPDQHQRLQDNPGLIDTAVEEFLRFESPLQLGNRLAGEDVNLSGKKVAAGTYIHMSIAGGNRDPEVFDNPEALDIARKPNRHLSFAGGHHVCLGATLARIEGQVAIGPLVQRFPNLRANGPAELLGLARFRGYKSLPVSI